MRAMILAGGLSTRLYPLTKQVPKPLVPVVGEPNAVHLIRYLKAYGFDDIAMNVHYLPQMIWKRWATVRRSGCIWSICMRAFCWAAPARWNK